MDEEWHAVCQAICRGVEGAKWEKLYYKFVDMNKTVHVRHRSGNSRANLLWNARDAAETEVTHTTIRTIKLKIVNQSAVRHELWVQHLQNPTLALDEAFRRVAVWDGR